MEFPGTTDDGAIGHLRALYARARLIRGVEERLLSLFAEGKSEDAGRNLFKVKVGQPRNKGLLRMMEDADKRRALDKSELSFYSDAQKQALFDLKEELFFTMDERAHEADLSEIGREFLNPDEPDAFVLPDLMTAFADIDNNHELNDAQKIEEKNKLQAVCDDTSKVVRERLAKVTLADLARGK